MAMTYRSLPPQPGLGCHLPSIPSWPLESLDPLDTTAICTEHQELPIRWSTGEGSQPQGAQQGILAENKSPGPWVSPQSPEENAGCPKGCPKSWTGMFDLFDLVMEKGIDKLIIWGTVPIFQETSKWILKRPQHVG